LPETHHEFGPPFFIKIPMRKKTGFALHHPQGIENQWRRNVFCEPHQTLLFLLFTDEILAQICIFVEIHHIF